VAQDLVGKLLELLKQAVPDVSRVALLVNANDRAKNDRIQAAAVAARALGVQLQVVEAGSPADFARAFSGMTQAGAGDLGRGCPPPCSSLSEAASWTWRQRTGYRRCSHTASLSMPGA